MSLVHLVADAPREPTPARSRTDPPNIGARNTEAATLDAEKLDGAKTDLARVDAPKVAGPKTDSPSETPATRSGPRPHVTGDAARGAEDTVAAPAPPRHDSVNADPQAGVAARSLEELVLARLREYAMSLQGHGAKNLYELIMPQLERPLVRVAMELANGRQRHAAAMLGIHRNTLRTRLKELGLDPHVGSHRCPRRGR